MNFYRSPAKPSMATTANIFEIMDVSIFFVARYFSESEYSWNVEKFGEKLQFNFGLKGSREGQIRKKKGIPVIKRSVKWLLLLPKQNQEARLDDIEACSEKKSLISVLRMNSSPAKYPCNDYRICDVDLWLWFLTYNSTSLRINIKISIEKSRKKSELTQKFLSAKKSAWTELNRHWQSSPSSLIGCRLFKPATTIKGKIDESGR